MRFMSITSAALFIAVVASPAMAADPTADMPVESSANIWSGVYVGVQVGGGWGKAFLQNEFVTTDRTTFDPSGAFGGGHVTALWQFGQIVAGVEAEANFAGIKDGGDISPPLGNFFDTKIQWFGSLDAKIGVPFDRLLVYGTAGVAFGGIEMSQNFTFLSETHSETNTSVGWTVGAGIDYALTDQIVVGAQYRYYDFGTESFTPPPASPLFDRHEDVDLHTVSLKASYKF